MNRARREEIENEMRKIGALGRHAANGHRCDDVVCPEHSVCDEGACNCVEGYSGVWEGGQLTCYPECTDPNARLGAGGECICKDGYLWDAEQEICREQCDPTPPNKGDGNCDTEEPCVGVTCMPPKVCEEGECVCPEGTVDKGGLCLPDDPCLNVLCPPNSACKEGVCVCDDGYVLNGKGYCVMAETAECTEEETCCPSNATIQIKAGSGLAGGGSFRLNQPCDKTIMLWVDDLSEVADEDCDEHGQAQVCSCTSEISKLMDIIIELKAEMEILKDNAKECLERNHCSGFDDGTTPEPTPEPTPGPSEGCSSDEDCPDGQICDNGTCKDPGGGGGGGDGGENNKDDCDGHVASGKECETNADCPDPCEECEVKGRETGPISTIFRTFP